MSPWMVLAQEARLAPSEKLLTQIQERRQRQRNSTRRNGGVQQMDTSTQLKRISLVASLIGLDLSEPQHSSRSQAAMGSQQMPRRLALLQLVVWMHGLLSWMTLMMAPMVLVVWVLVVLMGAPMVLTIRAMVSLRAAVPMNWMMTMMMMSSRWLNHPRFGTGIYTSPSPNVPPFLNPIPLFLMLLLHCCHIDSSSPPLTTSTSKSFGKIHIPSHSISSIFVLLGCLSPQFH